MSQQSIYFSQMISKRQHGWWAGDVRNQPMGLDLKPITFDTFQSTAPADRVGDHLKSY
jgi:hypothetical protein